MKLCLHDFWFDSLEKKSNAADSIVIKKKQYTILNVFFSCIVNFHEKEPSINLQK